MGTVRRAENGIDGKGKETERGRGERKRNEANWKEKGGKGWQYRSREKKKNRTGREQRGEMKGVCKNKSVSKFQLDWVCNVISLKQKSTEMPKFKLFGKLYRGP